MNTWKTFSQSSQKTSNVIVLSANSFVETLLRDNGVATMLAAAPNLESQG
ncbi:MAG TPA: hypothetical protein VEW46_08150 [Pyrinomonadaceae bacterium]|nr:hypothetical protein [Pyrinomonadaceae bacterium]